MSKRTLLWLDDYRDPYNDTWVLIFAPGYVNDDIVWVKSYDEFILWIEEYGLPDCIGFDHDLGFTNEYYIENDLESPEPDKTGYDCAKWLVEYCMDNNKKLPDWVIQSDNTVGKKNINCYLRNFLKSYDDN